MHRDNVERASSILSALALALEAKGLELVADERAMKVAVGKDTATFTLTEKSKRQKHLPTPAEQQAHDRRERRREQAAARGDWALYRSLPYERPWPEFDTVFSGHLVLTISGWNQGLRKNWADGKTQRMENMLDSIVGGIMAVLEISRQRREEAERWERERAELARRRDLMKRRREREEARIAHLRELVQLQREATEIQSWLGSLPDVEGDGQTELGRMIAWARDRLSSLEARTTIDAASAGVAGTALFPEVDDLVDPEGDPPEARGYW